MKKLLIFSLVCILLLPVLTVGCNKTEPTTTTPTETSPTATSSGQIAKTIEYYLSDFSSQNNNIVENVELAPATSLQVILESNGSTGYAWDEAAISNTAVIVQASRGSLPPATQNGQMLVGAAGKTVWVFDAKAAGTATIKMGYSRPWAGGEKNAFTLTINVP